MSNIFNIAFAIMTRPRAAAAIPVVFLNRTVKNAE